MKCFVSIYLARRLAHPTRDELTRSVQINFNQLARTHAFAEEATRQDLMDRLNAIPGVTLRSDALEKQPMLRLAALSADQGAGFFQVMDWMVERLRQTPAAASGVMSSEAM